VASPLPDRASKPGNRTIRTSESRDRDQGHRSREGAFEIGVRLLTNLGIGTQGSFSCSNAELKVGAAITFPTTSYSSAGKIPVECGKAATPPRDSCMLVYTVSGASMKKLAICLIAVAGLIGTPVLAADLATKGAPPPPPPPVFSWAGLYIGLNAGGVRQ